MDLIKPNEVIKLVYFLIFGAALLLLSAVAENGETEMSRVLVRRMSDVPQMIEALVAGFAFAVTGAAAAAYIERENT